MKVSNDVDSVARHQCTREELEYARTLISIYPNFPQSGIVFADILPLMCDPVAREITVRELCYLLKTNFPKVNTIAGIEARGLMIGLLIANELQLPFIPIRKAGKLPGDVAALTYQKEYGKDTLEIQKAITNSSQTVAIVDDIIAVGGTISAAYELLANVLKVNVVCCAVIADISGLLPSRQIPETLPMLKIYSL